MEGDWEYVPREQTNQEVEKRKVYALGVDENTDLKKIQELSKDKPDLSNAARINPREFAEMLGMPYISLQRLMKDHHERDPLVK